MLELIVFALLQINSLTSPEASIYNSSSQPVMNVDGDHGSGGWTGIDDEHGSGGWTGIDGEHGSGGWTGR